MDTVLSPQLDVASFGEFLRRARERRGLTLEQISAETKIPLRHLDALEHGNLDAIPGGMYQRAETRAYAQAVGLDESLALAQLELALKAAEPPEPERRRRGTDGWTAGRRGLAAIAVIAIAVIGLVVSWQAQPNPQAAAVAGAAPENTPDSESAPPTDAHPPRIVSESPGDVVAEPEPSSLGATPPPAGERANDSHATASEATALEATAPEAGQPQAAASADAGEAPAPRPAGRILEVTTDPPGARVLVNGIGRGISPIAVSLLPAGRVRVRVVMAGFESEERTVVLSERATTTISFSLRPLTASTTP